MVNVSPESIESLKYILENNLHPESLDSHPRTSSPILQEAGRDGSPGQRLVFAISQLFLQTMPSTPVRRGKRLDTRWAEFGILAALYFIPIECGTPAPVSLRDAWGRIDQSILHFVRGKKQAELSAAEADAYKLVGDEPEVASASTLSDWHRKGLQRLAGVIQARESYLARSVLEASSAAPVVGKKGPAGRASKARRFVILFFVMLVLGVLAWGGLKAYAVYKLALAVRQDARQLQSLLTKDGPRLERIREAGLALTILRQDFRALKSEVEPYLWIGRWLDWVPVYGGDLASAQDLVSLADSLLATADSSYRAVLPLAEENERAGFDLPRLTAALLQAQPQLSEARQNLELARAARGRLTLETLTPELQDLILNDVDRYLPMLRDGLVAGLELPRLLGATSEGPKTYLLLVQNEDELRPTGGFITAAGTLLLQDGKVSNLVFSNSGNADDWTKPYPAAPWQLREYMNSPVLIFRDTNWFVDYPTAVRYAEQLYSYTSNHSVDGVIAFDQQTLVVLLRVTGPIQVEGVDYAIDASNVVPYMRAAKTPTPEEAASPEWNNKAFINKITRALLGKIFSGDVELERLAPLFLNLLDEHHVLLQVDNSVVTTILEQYHWDGAIHTTEGDFLMVVDTNVGFNKTNAVVESREDYEVDLTKAASPKASLKVIRINKSAGVPSCNHWDKIRAAGEADYPIQDCYWNYLRVFTARGAILLNATPQTIPADCMFHKERLPARVDILDEGIDSVQEFGTLQVVPVSDSLTTSFQFLLPADVIQAGPESGQWLYRLRVQKQPGTRAIPFTIRIQLPENASVIRAPAGAVVKESSILLQTDLRMDVQIEVLYQVP